MVTVAGFNQCLSSQSTSVNLQLPAGVTVSSSGQSACVTFAATNPAGTTQNVPCVRSDAGGGFLRSIPRAVPTRSDVVHDDRVQDSHRRRGLPEPHDHRDGAPARHDAPLPRLLHPDWWGPGVRLRDPAHHRIRMTALGDVERRAARGPRAAWRDLGRWTATSPSMGCRRRDRRKATELGVTRLAADHQIRSRNATAHMTGFVGVGGHDKQQNGHRRRRCTTVRGSFRGSAITHCPKWTSSRSRRAKAASWHRGTGQVG